VNVVGFAGYSGSGKTTLLEPLIAHLVARGLRVAVVKHAHHRFDIDHEGKDSWRHRKAGACEVLVASDVRLALMREFAVPQEPEVHALIAEIDPTVDWVLVEGFRGSDLPKIEIWRAPTADFAGHPARYPQDGAIAVQTVGSRDADIWLFKVGPEETLVLPMGEIAARRLTRNARQPFDDTVELWLAPALGHLPVRIRLTQPNGDFADMQLREAPPHALAR